MGSTIPLLEGTHPSSTLLYQLSEKELKHLQEYIDKMKAKGFIQDSTSSASRPIYFVKKKNGGLRLVVDYRGLNRITVKNISKPPLIEEL